MLVDITSLKLRLLVTLVLMPQKDGNLIRNIMSCSYNHCHSISLTQSSYTTHPKMYGKAAKIKNYI